MKVKCTYKDCFRYFDDEKAMRRHKEKEPEHSYCKICDVDCEDDMYLFIHQLGSPNHICCPVCALEFKSTGGRDSHFATHHRNSSTITCAGCQRKFGSGSLLMAHIEKDECHVIRMEDFQMQRAERQIQKDAFAKTLDPFDLTPSNADRNSEVRGAAPIQAPEAKPIEEQFPALGSKPTTGKTHSQQPAATTDTNATGDLMEFPEPPPPTVQNHDDLIDLNEPGAAMSKLRISEQPWGFKQLSDHASQSASDPQVEGWLNNVDTNTLPSENVSEVASLYNKKQVSSDVSNSIPPSTRAIPNSNAPYKHIINMPAHSLVAPSEAVSVERFYDPTSRSYVCPTFKCKRKFRTPADFKNHLLTSSHVGNQVTCPSCLKKFATTAAWVAHSDSASKKCDIRNSYHYNSVMREITGGVLGTQGFHDSGAVKFVAPRIDQWQDEN